MSAPHPACNSFGCLVSDWLRPIIGISFVLLGVLMTVTFWLLPLGVPLALLGVAILGSDGV